MASNGNQPKQGDQSNKQQQSGSSKQGEDKGRTQSEGGSKRGNANDQRADKANTNRPNQPDQQGDRQGKESRGNNPDVTIPNPKNPGYGDNEPGDPRRLEIDANNPPQSAGKKDPRRS